MIDATTLSTLEFSLLLGLGALIAGALGAMTGLGGGVVIVPLLTLGFGVDMRYAIGASLLAVIATSSGAAAAFVREGYTNIRLGMFLEVATTAGALTGAGVAAGVSANLIALIFGAVLIVSACLSLAAPREPLPPGEGSRLAARLRLESTFPTPEGPQAYTVTAIPTGFALMFAAGLLSGLLGIGSGAIKVLALDRAMRVPFKVSTTTSNFMIGVTAAASAGVYLHRGYLDPGLAMPVVLGVLIGAMVGTKILTRGRVSILRLVFGVLVIALGLQMAYNGIRGGFSP